MPKLDRTLESYHQDINQLNSLRFRMSDGIRAGDIWMCLQKSNLENARDGKMSAIEFMYPMSMGICGETYKTLSDFIQDKGKNKDKNDLIYNHKEGSQAIRAAGKRLPYLEIRNTKDNILEVFIKGAMNDNPEAPLISQAEITLVTPETLSLYTGDKKDTIIITQKELHWMLQLMETIKKDVKKNPEIFKVNF